MRHTAHSSKNADTGLQWQGVWGVSAQRPNPYFEIGVELNAQTVRQTLVTYAQGDQLRLRISNAFGAVPLHIGAASIAHSVEGSTIAAGTPASITFGENCSIIVPPGASVLSDPLCFRIAPNERLAASLFFPEKTFISTAYCGLTVENYISAPGNHVDETHFPVSENTRAHPFLIGIDVLTQTRRPVIVALGDSITNGHDIHTSWPSRLAARLFNTSGLPASVINGGIPGNMLRSDIENPNMLARIDRDVLSIPGISHIIVSVGLNDIGRPNSLGFGGKLWQGTQYPARELLAAYRQLIARAHQHGLKIYGCTITPFGESFSHTSEKQKIHDEINAWILASSEFDAIIDFAGATADPHNPKALLPAYDMGDHVHLNQTGLQAMADAIDISLFDNAGAAQWERREGAPPSQG